jgi:hypothetical protein
LASDSGADGQIRNIELDRDRVVLRRAVRGIPMKVGVPVSEFRGITLRILPPEGDQPAMAAVMLEHRDSALTVPLFLAVEGVDAVAEWKCWSRVFGLPLLVDDATAPCASHWPASAKLAQASRNRVGAAGPQSGGEGLRS